MTATRVLQCQWTFVFMMTLLLFTNGLPFYERDTAQGMEDDPAEQHVISSRQTDDEVIDLTKLSNTTGGNLTGKASPLNSTFNHTTGHASSQTASLPLSLQQNPTKSFIPQNNASIQATRPIPTKTTATRNTSVTSTVLLIEPKPSKTLSNHVVNIVSTANVSSLPANITSRTNVTKVLAATAKVKTTSPTPLLKANNITTVVTLPSHTKSTPNESKTAQPKMSASALGQAPISSRVPSVKVTKMAQSVSLSSSTVQSSVARATAQVIPTQKESPRNSTVPNKTATKLPAKPITQTPSPKLPTERKVTQVTTQPSAKPSISKPSTKPPTEPTTKQPTTKQPTTKQPTTKQPSAGKPSTVTSKKASTKQLTVKQPTTQATKPQTQPPTTKPTTKLEPKPSTKSSTKPATKLATKPPAVKVTTKAKPAKEETTLRPETQPPVKQITTAAKKQNNAQNDAGVMASPNKDKEAVLWDFIVPVGIGVAVALAVAFGVLMVRTCRRKRLIRVRFGGKPSHPRLLNNDLINLLAESDDEEE